MSYMETLRARKRAEQEAAAAAVSEPAPSPEPDTTTPALAPEPAPEPADTAAAPKPPAAPKPKRQPKPKPKDEPQSDLAGASEEELQSQLDKIRKEKEEQEKAERARREADTPEKRRRLKIEQMVQERRQAPTLVGGARKETADAIMSANPIGVGFRIASGIAETAGADPFYRLPVETTEQDVRQSRGGIIQEPRAPEGSKLTAAQSLRRTVKDSEGNKVDKGIEVALDEAIAERDKIKADMAAGRRASFAAPPTISRREAGLPSGKDIEDYSPEELRMEADRRQKQAELRSERSQRVSPSRLETVVKRIEALRRLESEFRQRAKKEAEQASAAEG